MAARDPEPVDARRSKRVPIEAEIQLEFESFQGFLTEYSGNISEGGMFVRSSNPPLVGSTVHFCLKLDDDFQLIRGRGDIVWVREDESTDQPEGMGIRFLELVEPSSSLIRKIVERERQEGRPPFDLEDRGPRPEPLSGAARPASAAAAHDAGEPRPDHPEPLSGAVLSPLPDAELEAMIGTPSRRTGPRKEATSDPSAPPQSLPVLDLPELDLPAVDIPMPDIPVRDIPVTDIHPTTSTELNLGGLGAPELDSDIEEADLFAEAELGQQSRRGAPASPGAGFDSEEVDSFAEGTADSSRDLSEAVAAMSSAEKMAAPAPTGGQTSEPRGVASRRQRVQVSPTLAGLLVLAAVFGAAAFWLTGTVASWLTGTGGPAVVGPMPKERTPISPAPTEPAPAEEVPAGEEGDGMSPPRDSSRGTAETDLAESVGGTAALPPLSRIRLITAKSAGQEGGTRVTLWGNGAARHEDIEQIRLERKVVIKLKNIEGPTREPIFELGTSELERARTGFHPKADGNELHIVLDLTDPAVQLSRLDLDGENIQLLLTR